MGAKNPGSTWPSDTVLNKSTSWAKFADDRDRIDFIYFRSGPAYVLKAYNITLAGSRRYYAYDQLVTDTTDPFILEDMEWPSDHKAVIADFQPSKGTM